MEEVCLQECRRQDTRGDGKRRSKGGRMWAEPLTEERMEFFISASGGGGLGLGEGHRGLIVS